MRKTKYLLRFFQLLSSSFLFDSCHLASCSAYTSQKLTYALWKIPCRSQACGSLCPSCFGSTIDVCLYVCLFSSGTAAFAGPLCPILWINKYSKRKKKKKNQQPQVWDLPQWLPSLIGSFHPSRFQLSWLLSDEFEEFWQVFSNPTLIVFLNCRRTNMMPITLSYIDIGCFMALIFILTVRLCSIKMY